jgi:hypothetical protein
MAKHKVTCQMVSRHALKALLAKPHTAAAGPLAVFQLPNDVDQPFTVAGTDAAGNPVPFDPAVVTMTSSSDNPAVATIDPPSGVTDTIHAATPPPAVGATATITITITWNDSSNGPYTITWPMTIVAGKVTGITVQPGTPSVH